jgi:exodeoxyribonuclease-3
MRITSWNVNGLRAAYKKGAFEWLIKENPDIFCLQETKATPDQLQPEAHSPDGYSSYFSWPKEKKGYSGVAIYSKTRPDMVRISCLLPFISRMAAAVPNGLITSSATTMRS